jgi:hypothetical protein
MTATASSSACCNHTDGACKLTLLQSTVKQLAAMHRGYLGTLVQDIPEARMAEQFPGVPNHPAWHLGHLAVSADQLIEVFGGKRRFDEATWGKYGMGSTPVGDRAAYPSKEECLSMFDERRNALVAAFLAAPPERLTAGNPVASLAAQLPTIADLATFLILTHEGMHFGQLATWRKAAGMKGALAGT